VVGWSDATLRRPQRHCGCAANDATERIRHIRQFVVGETITDGTSILGSARFQPQHQNHQTNRTHENKTALTCNFYRTGHRSIANFSFGRSLKQTSANVSSVHPGGKRHRLSKCKGWIPNSDSMKQMAEMCMRMMNSEKAAMPYIIAVSVLFGLLLFVALVLLIVLEILWISIGAES